MKTEFYGAPVAGGTFPAQIWGTYMQKVKGKFCGAFEQPTEPFQSMPFFGRYSKSAVRDDYSAPSGSATPTPDSTGGATPDKEKGDDGGGQGEFDPDLYESPPQEAPAPETPPPGEGGGAEAPPG
jgi:penicillin-binding protein 1A